MTYYLLPKTNSNIYKYLQYSCNEEPHAIISNSLSRYLYEIKEKITNKEKSWDIYKKYTNPCEYIHTVVPFKKKSVSKYHPLSRSYFKMIEILNIFAVQFKSTNIETFHLAEGPGGFIEAIVKTRANENDKYYGMTLQDENNDANIPAWKKSQRFLRENPNVILENGKDGTGNILNLENFEYVSSKYAGTIDFITADGGFDFSLDFNQQEIMIGKLLFAQTAFALCIQKRGGIFILKIFDCFMKHTIDILYLLASFYEKVYVIKPKTSRYGNSEKYIVCIGFLHDNNTAFYPYLHRCFTDLLSNDKNSNRFLTFDIPYYFIQKLEEYNAIFGQKQIQNIHYTFSLLINKGKQDKIEILIKNNIQKSLEWCIKYNVPYNNLTVSNNIFLNNGTNTDWKNFHFLDIE